jgi:uncharacterized RDD family membrane protein YckC
VPPAPPAYGTPPPGYPPGAPPPGYAAPGYPQGGYGFNTRPQLAGFGARLGGYLLDGLLYGLVMIPFVIAFVALLALGFEDCVTVNDQMVCGGNAKAGPIVGSVVVLLAGFVLIVVLYLRALATTGQTWGRKIVGIKVVRDDNYRPPGWGKAIGRSLFASIISSYVLYLGYLWMLWDDKNQTWHDKVAGTLVVRA